MNVDETELLPGSENTSSFKVVVIGMRSRFFSICIMEARFERFSKGFDFFEKFLGTRSTQSLSWISTIILLCRIHVGLRH